MIENGSLHRPLVNTSLQYFLNFLVVNKIKQPLHARNYLRFSGFTKSYKRPVSLGIFQ